MNMSERLAVVVRPDIAPGQRVLAISDIHGNLPFLRGVLDKARFTPEDVLVLVGDLIEKGEDSLGVLRYVMQLQRTHKVYPLCGNCDRWTVLFLRGEEGTEDKLLPYFQFRRARALAIQMGRELGLDVPETKEDMVRLRQALWEHMPRECQFLLDMPQVLEAGNFIFAHGGVMRDENLDTLPADGCMGWDNFLGEGLSFRKWVVVGHWPVTLYNPRVPTARPLILPQRHIASIDGGCVLKVDGQLNALIIPDVYGEALDYVAYDGLPVVVAEEDQAPSQDSINIRWSDRTVEILREEGDGCWCRHVSSGREVWILREYLYFQKDGTVHCEDSTDYLLPVTAGERLSLVRRCSRGILAKKDGVTGWYRGKFREITDDK